MDTNGINPELLDSSITVTLKASQWQVIINHLELSHLLSRLLGQAQFARPLSDELFAQAKPQLDAALSAASQAMTSTDGQHSRKN
jgi:hypothetical protein